MTVLARFLAIRPKRTHCTHTKNQKSKKLREKKQKTRSFSKKQQCFCKKALTNKVLYTILKRISTIFYLFLHFWRSFSPFFHFLIFIFKK